jgi:hypothetical protein
MSTIFFGAKELARCAVFAVGNTSSSEGKRQLEAYCDSLEHFSAANAEAFEARYNEKTLGHSIQELKEEAFANRMPPNTVKECESLCGWIGLLRYNLDDCATIEALDVIVDLMLSPAYLRHAHAARH